MCKYDIYYLLYVLTKVDFHAKVELVILWRFKRRTVQ